MRRVEGKYTFTDKNTSIYIELEVNKNGFLTIHMLCDPKWPPIQLSPNSLSAIAKLCDEAIEEIIHMPKEVLEPEPQEFTV